MLSASDAARKANDLLSNVERALRGKPDVVLRATIALIGRGHLLLEDVLLHQELGPDDLVACELSIELDAQQRRAG